MELKMPEVAGWVKGWVDRWFLRKVGDNTYTGDLTVDGALSSTTLTAPTVTGSTALITPEVRAAGAAGLRLEDDGNNLGIFIKAGGLVGVTTSDVEAWHASYRAMQLADNALFWGTTGTNLNVLSNAYYDGAWKRRTANLASSISQYNGIIDLYTALTSDADSTITWVTGLEVNNGRVGVGVAPAVTETSDRLTVEGADNTALTSSIINTGTGQVAWVLRRTGGTAARWYQYIPSGSEDLRFYHGGDRLILTAAGKVAIDGTIDGTYTVAIGNNDADNSLLVTGNSYFTNNVSAASFTDRTKGYTGDALDELAGVKTKDGELDHSTLPEFAKSEGGQGRDLGAMISLLTVAVQQLAVRIETLETK